MSKKQPVMSHDPLAGLGENGAADAPFFSDDAAAPPTADEDTSGFAVVALETAPGITEVGELHQQLLSHVRTMMPIRIDAAEVESIDTAVLQLIASAYKTAREKGLELSLVEPSEAFVAAAQQLGLDALFDIDAHRATA